MTRYVKFTENNDHEGESWNFWLPVDGNEQELEVLAVLVATDDEYPEYELDLDHPEDETAVDAFVRRAKQVEGGYMDSDNKVTGVLTVPPDLDVDKLYKGGIKGLFKAGAEEAS